MAILAGDFLLARASVSLAALRNSDVIQLLSQVIEDLVSGEIMQVWLKLTQPVFKIASKFQLHVLMSAPFQCTRRSVLATRCAPSFSAWRLEATFISTRRSHHFLQASRLRTNSENANVVHRR